jgi:hypothetical protein
MSAENISTDAAAKEILRNEKPLKHCFPGAKPLFYINRAREKRPKEYGFSKAGKRRAGRQERVRCST